VIKHGFPGRLRAADIERAWNALLSMPRARSYPVLGVALALGAPAGLLVARAMAAGQLPTLTWGVADIEHLPATYAYVAFSTVAVFAVLGSAFGRSFDRVRRLSVTDPLTGSSTAATSDSGWPRRSGEAGARGMPRPSVRGHRSAQGDQ